MCETLKPFMKKAQSTSKIQAMTLVIIRTYNFPLMLGR